MKLNAITMIIIVILTGMCAVPAVAAWSQDPTVNTPVCTEIGDQKYMWSIGDGAGGTILCWRDERFGSGLDCEIFAQRLDSEGNELWAPDGVSIYNAGYINYEMALVSDGTGGAIITWYGGPTSPADIYAQRVSAGGMLLWTADGVAICSAGSIQYDPRLISDGAGGAIIAWDDSRDNETNDRDIYVQRVDRFGVVQWTTDGVPICTEAEGQYDPLLTNDGAGGAIITWVDNRASNYDIYAQRIDGSGVPQWTAGGVAICTAAGDQQWHRIVSASTGGAIIGWVGDPVPLEYRVYAQKIGTDGTVQWAVDGVPVSAANDNGQYIEVVPDDTGGAVFAWLDNRNGDADIYAQRINTNGGQRWLAGGIQVCGAFNDQSDPSIARNENDGVIISWTDDRFTSGALDIYAQHVDWFGNTHWAANGIPICSAVEDQYWSRVASDGSGGAIITWSDERSGVDTDIYAQWVDANGFLGGLGTINAALGCLPCSGTAPFSTRFRATMYNLLDDQFRRVAGRMNILLANGSQVNNWRAGSTTLSPGEAFNVSWYSTIPAISSMIGHNGFTLELEDVTQAPYNQPPYMPSGDTDSANVTVTAIAP